MQTRSKVKWMPIQEFYHKKKYMDGYIFYRIVGEYAMVRQVRPSVAIGRYINETNAIK